MFKHADILPSRNKKSISKCEGLGFTGEKYDILSNTVTFI